MSVLRSYDLNGKKLSFANWISNLSPMDCPFSSMTRKDKTNQVVFQWQTDSLQQAGRNVHGEGDRAQSIPLRSTSTKSNTVQILRKVVKISDTANALDTYGRDKEVKYQLEKAGKEIKRDLEYALLTNKNAEQDVDGTTPRKTAGYRGLVAPLNMPCPETGAITTIETANPNAISELDIFHLLFSLYTAGSEADTIMYHPKWASFFSSLQESQGTYKGLDGNPVTNRQRMFNNTPKLSVYVSTLVDQLGQEFKLIPNRWMPDDAIYIFNPDNWSQVLLREPQRTQLAKDGSYEKWMVEMEVGLRHVNPYSSGLLMIKPAVPIVENITDVIYKTGSAGADNIDPASFGENTGKLTAGSKFVITLKAPSAKVDHIDLYKDDLLYASKLPVPTGGAFTHVISESVDTKDAGIYYAIGLKKGAVGSSYKYVEQTDSYGLKVDAQPYTKADEIQTEVVEVKPQRKPRAKKAKE